MSEPSLLPLQKKVLEEGYNLPRAPSATSLYKSCRHFLNQYPLAWDGFLYFAGLDTIMG